MPDIRLLTVDGSTYGPYVGRLFAAGPSGYHVHLFTRATAELMIADLHRDDCGMTGRFSPEGTLTLTWDASYDGQGGTRQIVPDAHGLYAIGGLWPREEWTTDREAATPGQAAFAAGALGHNLPPQADTYAEPLRALYLQGRQEAQRVMRGADGTPPESARDWAVCTRSGEIVSCDSRPTAENLAQGRPHLTVIHRTPGEGWQITDFAETTDPLTTLVQALGPLIESECDAETRPIDGEPHALGITLPGGARVVLELTRA